MAIAVAIDHGKREEWAPSVVVPTRVKRAIERGLAADPSERWPSMAALLAELEPEAPRRVGPIALAIGAVGLVGSGVVGAWLAQPDPEAAADPCADVGEVVRAEAWTPAARTELEQAIRTTGLSYADETAERVLPYLDRYASEWAAAREQTCVAFHTDKIQTEQVHDARVRCLERSLVELDALVEALTTVTSGDARTLGRASDAVFELPSLDRCADVEALLAEVPPPDDPRAAEAVTAAQRMLVEADARRMAGDMAEAEVRLERAAALAAAEAPQYLPLRAELALAEGQLRGDQGRFADAAAALERAHLDARRSGHREVAIQSIVTLVYVAGYRLARYQEAELWARIAHAEVDRAGATTPAHAELLNREGILHGRQGRFVEARDHYLRAKALYEELGATDSPGYDSMFTNLGLVRLNLGEVELAHQHLVDALTRNRARYGATHPRVVGALTNLANASVQLGDLDEGLRLAQDAVRTAERALAPEHVNVGSAHASLALAALAHGDLELAQRSADHAFEIQLAALGDEHPAVAEGRSQRAEILWLRGREDEALVEASQARELLLGRFGPTDWRTAEATSVLAEIQAGRDPEEGLRLAEAVLAQIDHDSARSQLPRARAWLVVAKLAASPEAAADARAEAASELDHAGGLGQHLRAQLAPRLED